MTRPLLDYAGNDAALNRLRKKLRRESVPLRVPMPKSEGPPPLRARLARLHERALSPGSQS